MATQTITRITDDIDGSPDATTVTFGYQGIAYTIDLSAKNVDRLQKALAPFIDRGQRLRYGAGTRSGVTSAGSARPARSGGKSAAVREWAALNKVTVPARGRIPATTMDLYHQSTGL